MASLSLRTAPLAYIAIFLSFFAVPLSASALSSQIPTSSPLESAIVTQLRNGLAADLSFASTSSLQATFLFRLLRSDALKGTPQGLVIYNATVHGDLRILYSTIEYPVHFKNCVFLGEVSLRGTTLVSDFGLDGCTFTKPLNMSFIVANRSLYLTGSSFLSGIDLKFAHVQYNLEALNASFGRHAGLNDFLMINVDRIAFFKNCHFFQETAFSGSVIPTRFILENSTFCKKAFFSSCRFGDVKAAKVSFHDEVVFAETYIDGNADFSECTFNNNANFYRVHVRDNFMAIAAVQSNKASSFSLHRAEIGDSLLLMGTLFNGSCDFRWISVSKVLDLSECQFPNCELDLERLVVNERCMMNNMQLSSGISAQSARLTSLHIRDYRKSGKPWDLDISRTHISEDMFFEGLNLGILRAQGLRVDSMAFLSSCSILQKFDFEAANAKIIVFSDNTWPSKGGSVMLSGATYQYIRDVRGRGASGLLDLLGKCKPYSAEAYEGVEMAFRRQGNLTEADDVFFARKRRERSEVLTGPRRLLSLFGEHVLGYGRRLGPPVRAMVILLLAGWLYCWRLAHRYEWWIDRLEERLGENSSSKRNAMWQRSMLSFWYTLQVLSPIAVDKNGLSIKDAQGIVFAWVWCLKVGGIILLGAMLGAVTGLIK